MECPRGSETTESTHTVKTFEKAREWYQYVDVQDLPIKIEQNKAFNGRLAITIRDKDGYIIHKRG